MHALQTASGIYMEKYGELKLDQKVLHIFFSVCGANTYLLYLVVFHKIDRIE